MSNLVFLPNRTPTAPSPGVGGSFEVQGDGTLLRLNPIPSDPAPAAPTALAAPAITGESTDPYPQE